eukprot:6190088-Pleurochrysis_carterae.AAC.2
MVPAAGERDVGRPRDTHTRLAARKRTRSLAIPHARTRTHQRVCFMGRAERSLGYLSVGAAQCSPSRGHTILRKREDARERPGREFRMRNRAFTFGAKAEAKRRLVA